MPNKTREFKFFMGAYEENSKRAYGCMRSKKKPVVWKEVRGEGQPGRCFPWEDGQETSRNRRLSDALIGSFQSSAVLL